ncbi:MAG: hypothetical protein KGZ38_02560 [Erysipelothrix sp.]|nr:hypothetical protein [Erysipelothrix sp.]
MKIKQLLFTFMLISLSGCALAKSEEPILNQENDPTPVGIYVVMSQDLFNIDPPFDINDSSQTYFIQDKHVGEDGEVYSYSKGSGQFFESNTHIHVSDDEEKTVFTASLPVFSNMPQIARFYTIYKDKNEHYFTEQSNSYHFQYGGGVKSEYSNTETINGVSKKKTIIFDITLKAYDPLQSLQLIMMNERYEIMSTQVIKDESDIKIDENVAYVLIEEVRLNNEDKEVKTLTMVDANQLKDIPYYHTMITSPDYPRGMVVGLKLYK